MDGCMEYRSFRFISVYMYIRNNLSSRIIINTSVADFMQVFTNK